MKILSVTVVLATFLASASWADKKLDDAVAKANDLVAKQKPDEAVKTLQKLVQQSPSSPEALVAFGSLCDRVGQEANLNEADAALAKAVQAAAGAAPAIHAQALAAHASHLLKRGNSLTALAQAKKAVELQPNAETLATLARAEARFENGAAALQTADKAIQADAGSALAHEAKGEALLASGRPADAVAAFRKAASLAPLSRFRVGVARALLAQGKAGEAVTEAQATSTADPNSAEALAVLGLAQIKAKPKDQATWNEAIGNAQSGKFYDPKSVVALDAVAQIFESAGQYDQTAQYYASLLQIDPGSIAAGLANVDALYRGNKIDEAIKAVDALAKMAPGSGRVLFLNGELLLRKENYQAAVPVLERAVALLPGSAEAHYYLGRAYLFTAGKGAKDAVGPYGKATELDPNNCDFRVVYGLTLAGVGRCEDAVQQLQKAIAMPACKGPDAYINLGYTYRKCNKTEDAITSYRKALEIDPKNYQAAIGLAWVLYNNQRWDDAITAFEGVIKIDPTAKGDVALPITACYFEKAKVSKEFSKLDEWLGVAKAELGADHKTVIAVSEAVQLLKKGGPAKKLEIDQEVDCGAAIRTAMNDAAKPDVRARAVRTMAGCGRDAVPFLASLLNGDKIPVLNATLTSIKSMGGTACGALPAMERVAKTELRVKIDVTIEEAKWELAWQDYQKAVKEYLPKMRQTCGK